MEDAILQRVNKVLDNKGVSITYLSKELGVVQTTLNRQIKGDVQLSSATIEAFLHFFQDVSSEWLLRGNGSMLKSSSPFDDSISLIEELKAENNQLKGENRILREQAGLGERKESGNKIV